MIEQEVTLEMGGGVAQLIISSQIDEYLGDRKLAKKVPVELESVIMPEFYSMALNSSVTLFAGQYNLLGSFTPSGDADKRVLLLVKFDLVK